MNPGQDPSGPDGRRAESSRAGTPRDAARAGQRLDEQDLVSLIPLIRVWAERQKDRLNSPNVETASVLDSAFASVLPKVRAGDFEHAGQLVNWLKKAVENEIRGRRRTQRRSGLPLDGEPSAGSSLGPSRKLQRIEDLESVRTGLASLALDDQAVITLRHREGLSHVQIAERLGIEETAAKVRYHRAVRRLAAAMEVMARSGSCSSASPDSPPRAASSDDRSRG